MADGSGPLSFNFPLPLCAVAKANVDPVAVPERLAA